MKMNKDIKRRWVAALRSGEYKQIKGALRKNDGFCCLGVLCDIYSKELNVEWEGNYIADGGGFLPSKVVKWAGVNDDDPTAGSTTLSFHNDDDVPFPKIANLINRYL